MFEPLDHAPAYARLAESIRARILGRELEPGSVLPTETELARQFAVNRSTVREALRNLQSAARRREASQVEELATLARQFAAADLPAGEAVDTVGMFFRAVGRASGNPVFVIANEPLVQLVEPGLAIIIDRVPQARRRIAVAQAALVDAIRRRAGNTAATWMRRHVEDFRRGFDAAGVPLDTIVSGSRIAGR
jgi:GntR family transcriptional repressor for pyruvate dehydrogenase complex